MIVKTKNLIFAALVLAMAACSGSDSGLSVDYLPVKVEKGDNWGMVDSDGKMLFSDEFEEEPSMVINGYFHVKENDGYSVYKAGEKPGLVNGLEGLKVVGEFSEGVIPIVRPKQRIEYVNDKGETKFTLEPINGKEIIAVHAYFSDGMSCIVNEDEKYGAITTNGKVAIQPSFDNIYSFKEGYALAVNKKDDGPSYCIINKKGEEVVKFKKDMAPLGRFVINNAIAVKYDDHCGFLNLKGEFTKCPSKVEDIGERNNKFYAYKSSDKNWGVMDYDGEIIVRAKYRKISLIDDKILAQKDGKVYILDSKGETLSTIDDASDIECLPEELHSAKPEFIVKDGDTYALYNLEGKQVGKDTFVGIGTKWSYDYICSDYFDVNAVAAKVLNYIEDDGIAGVKVGDAAGNYLDKDKALEEYVGQHYIYCNSKVEGGYRYSIYLEIQADDRVVNREPVYTTKYYGSYPYQSFDHYDYSVNDNSKVSYDLLLVVSQTDFYDDAFEEVYNGLKNKGWSESEKTGNYAYLQKKDKAILIFPGSTSVLSVILLEDKNVSSIIDQVRNVASQVSSDDSMQDDLPE